MIAENMRREWLNVEPGPRCFDASEWNMDQLQRMFVGGSSPAENRNAREHILTCCRCRYICGVVREASGGERGGESRNQKDD
jgi:hypothetical protein